MHIRVQVYDRLSFAGGINFEWSLTYEGEVHSLLPPMIKTMALTATATITLRSEICDVLGMKYQHVDLSFIGQE